ncbi:class D sortase [Oceanobacillus sp. 1P07AA]|uniref:class D sortase n=1 Tax=Oceanobacillus sp. 1P07AA TaxID=3132293 RepID=UPI0039A6EC5A
MKLFGRLLLIVGVVLIGIAGFHLFQTEKLQDEALHEAEQRIKQGLTEVEESASVDETEPKEFQTETGEAFGTLEIPKLDKTLPIVAGTDPDSLDRGVGHLDNSVLPSQGEQIVLSGHRDTVFRNFDQIEIGDQYIVHLPYGSYTYEIKETEIVPEDDTSVIRQMGEEVLVVTTCYPFHYVGNAPERFVTYAYPVEMHANGD